MLGVSKNWRYTRHNYGINLVKKNVSFPRCYATPSFVHPKLVRSEELLGEAYSLVDKGDWYNVYSLLETALEMQEKYGGDLKGPVASSLYYLLGVTYMRIQKYQLSEENFRSAIDNLKNETDEASVKKLSLVFFNFSQLLSSVNKTDEAIDVLKESMRLSAAAGNNTVTIHLAQLNNLSIYLASASRYDEARVQCEEALSLAIKDLGRDNKFTRSCFSNLCLILTKLGDSAGISALQNKWETCDQVTPADVKGISSDEFNNIVEELSYTVKKLQPRCVPHGPVKGSTIFKEEIKQFLDLWKERGNTIDECLYEPLDQEIDAIKLGQKSRMRLDNALAKARKTYAGEALASLEREIDDEMKWRQDKVKRRDIRIFQEETQYTGKLLQAADLTFYNLDGEDIDDDVKDDEYDDEEGDGAKAKKEGEEEEPFDADDEDGGLRLLLQDPEIEGDDDVYLDKPEEMSDEEWKLYLDSTRRAMDKEVEYPEDTFYLNGRHDSKKGFGANFDKNRVAEEEEEEESSDYDEEVEEGEEEEGSDSEEKK